MMPLAHNYDPATIVSRVPSPSNSFLDMPLEKLAVVLEDELAAATLVLTRATTATDENQRIEAYEKLERAWARAEKEENAAKLLPEETQSLRVSDNPSFRGTKSFELSTWAEPIKNFEEERQILKTQNVKMLLNSAGLSSDTPKTLGWKAV
ncbi:MAG: hypothetical protein LQ352_005746 [Teloschistes flavicans]|nr:MAG: hypothetical protein LQ352_005746 [Teloschistes flavicans]